LPYVWNGNNYSATGIYSVTLTNASGCDSVATLELTVNATSVSTTRVSTCVNLLPYSWNGNSYNAGGTYSVTLTNGFGCDSVATLELTVNNTSAATENRSICRSQLPLLWNGISINEAGNFTKLLTGVAGCDSTANLVLTVIDTVFSTTRVSVCSSDVPYVWNGSSYSTSGIYRKSFPAASGCDSLAVLDLLVREPVTTNLVQSVCASELPYNWQNQTLTQTGIYTQVVSDAYGCDSILRLSFTVLALPTRPSLGNDTLICAGDKLLLNPGPYSSYQWQDNSAGSTYMVDRSGMYYVFVSGNNGCSNSDTIRVNLLTDCADISFPSAFSPNNDGKNDRFGPLGNLALVSDYRLQVFNRYGQLVFSSDNPFRKWDGAGGKDPMAAYTWIASYTYKKAMRKIQRGTLVLLR
jgi:gliding motility-associated-like protein